MSNRVLIDQSNNTITTDTTSTQNNVILNSDNPDVITVVENVSNIIAISVPGLRGPTGEQGPQGPQGPSGSIDPNYNTGSFSGSFTGLLIGTSSWAQNAVTASYVANASSFPFTGSAIISGSLTVTGSFNATQGITGYLFGTASWAQNAITASYVPASGVVGLNLSQISSGSVSASVNTNISASFRITSGSNTLLNVTRDGFVWIGNGSFVNQGFQLEVQGSGLISGFKIGSDGNANESNVHHITKNVGTAIALTNVSPGGSSAIWAGTNATPVSRVMVLGTGDIWMLPSTGVIVGGTTYAGFRHDVQGTGRYTNNLTVTGSIVATQAVTASNALITGTLTAQTLVVQTITSSTDFVTGSTRFGSLLSNTHEFTGSVSITGSLTLPYLSTGSVLFAGATDNITEDNTNFFWDNTNKRLGIGTNAPDYAITIRRPVSGLIASFGSTNQKGVTLTETVNGTGLITAHNYDTSAPTPGPAASAVIGFNGSTSNFYGIGVGELRSSKYDIWFQTGVVNGGGYRFYRGTTELMSLFTTGNLGIGSTNDTGERLQVSGSSIIRTNSTFYTKVSIVGGDQVIENVATGPAVARLNMTGPNGSEIQLNSAAFFTYGGAGGAIGTINSTDFRVFTNSLERARFTAAGRLLLGTVSEGIFLLDVNGTARVSGNTQITGSLIVTQGITGSLQGTASWANNAITSSYATSFYVSGTLNVGNTNIEFQENTNVTSGSWRVVSSEPTASYRAAFFDYVMFSGSIARAGTVYSVWSASYAEYYENYTGDVGGSTAGVSLQAAISGSNIQLQATASNNAWTIRSLVRML